MGDDTFEEFKILFKSILSLSSRDVEFCIVTDEIETKPLLIAFFERMVVQRARIRVKYTLRATNATQVTQWRQRAHARAWVENFGTEGVFADLSPHYSRARENLGV